MLDKSEYDIIIIHTANLRPTESNQQKAWLLYKNDMNHSKR